MTTFAVTVVLLLTMSESDRTWCATHWDPLQQNVSSCLLARDSVLTQHLRKQRDKKSLDSFSNCSIWNSSLAMIKEILEIFQNLAKSIRMLRSLSEYIRILINLSKSFKILKHLKKLFRILRNLSECFRKRQNLLIMRNMYMILIHLVFQ